MRKLFLIAFKDFKLIFRDRAALILMLLAPFALTIGMGFVTGRFSGGSAPGISHIPVAIVNQDDGELGQALVGMFQSTELENLVDTTLTTDLPAAKQSVDDDQYAAALFIPAGFSSSIIPQNGAPAGDGVVQVEIYSNPTRPTSVGILKSILEQFMSQVEVGRVSGQVTVTQLITNGYIDPSQAAEIGRSVGMSQSNTSGEASSIKLNSVTASGEEVKFDVLAFLAPGMALMFLMFTVSYGGRSLIVEEAQGTLPRLLISPTNSTQILGGKVLGIFFTGTAQLLILILGTSLLFQLEWGDPLGVLVLVLAAAAGATGWGMILTAFLQTPGQISAIGSALMLIFGILGGSFVSLEMLPDWVKLISKITPNAWGLDGFTTLAMGGSLKNILTPVGALLGMGVILFVIAVLAIRHRGIGRR